MEVLTGFETFARKFSAQALVPSVSRVSCGCAPSYWHAEAVLYVSVWRNIEVDRGTCDVIREGNVECGSNSMVRGARQATKVYEDDGYGTVSVLYG
jgi:hypothetical protein